MELNVRALKGAPLSIVIVLMLQKRSVSHALLCQETGYSGNTVTQGLEYLVNNQIVTRCGHSGFMLTGENYQLPLYWNEQTEPADPSPAFAAPELPAVKTEPEKFSGKISESENRKIYDLEKKVAELETMIFEMSRNFYDLKSQLNQKNTPEIVNSTIEIANSATLIKNQEINTHPDNDVDDSLIDSEELREICDFYMRKTCLNKCNCEDHGIVYSDKELRELIELHPDPEVLEFVLPRAESFESAKKWCNRDIKQVKYHLLKIFGVTMPALQRITNNDDISPWLIDHHYWEWYQEHDPAHTLGWVVKKIENLYDRMNAENSSPLQYRYLEA